MYDVSKFGRRFTALLALEQARGLLNHEIRSQYFCCASGLLALLYKYNILADQILAACHGNKSNKTLPLLSYKQIFIDCCLPATLMPFLQIQFKYSYSNIEAIVKSQVCTVCG